jgi:sodium/bile acid cotransporter 7
LPKEGATYDEIYRRVFKQLGLSIFLPMVVGQVIQNIFPKPVQKLKDWNINKLGSFALLAVIWQTFDQAFAAGTFTSVQSSNMIFIVFISIALFLFWLAITFTIGAVFLTREDTVSTCFCIPAKTPAMGVPLATVMFVGLSTLEGAKLQIPIVIYQGLQIFFSSFLTHIFRRWIRAGKKAEELKASADTEGQVEVKPPAGEMYQVGS